MALTSAKVGDKLAYIPNDKSGQWRKVTVRKVNRGGLFRGHFKITLSNGRSFWRDGFSADEEHSREYLSSIEYAERTQPERDKYKASKGTSSMGWGLCGWGRYQD